MTHTKYLILDAKEAKAAKGQISQTLEFAEAERSTVKRVKAAITE